MARQFTLISSARPPKFDEVTTQKAKGLAILPHLDASLFGQDFAARDFRVWPVNASLGKLPAFARPCPVTPKHGFVESREVKGWEDFESIKQETLYQDGNAELILMPKLSGKYSGIMTPQNVSWGRGHDGATSGESKVIPTPDSCFDGVIDASVQTNAKIADGEVPYLELVEHDGDIKGVQLRSGPAQPMSADYIPRKAEITRIIESRNFADDLLGFDMELKKLFGNYGHGLACSAPGSSLASHYAVQCMILGIACMTTREPILGETLIPEESTTRRDWLQSDYQRLANAIGRILTCAPDQRWQLAGNDQDGLCKLAVGGMHAHVIWEPESHLLNLIAHGVAACSIFTIAASLGECRHWYNAGPGRNGSNRNPCDYCNCNARCRAVEIRAESARESGNVGPESSVPFSKGNSLSRGDVYEKALWLPLSDLLEQGQAASNDLGHEDWAGGYGGKGWHAGAQAGVDLLTRLVEFALLPNREAWQLCQTAWNHAVNQQHNNGKILNKWINGRVFDRAAKAPSFTFVTRASAEITIDCPAPLATPDLFLNHGLKAQTKGLI